MNVVARLLRYADLRLLKGGQKTRFGKVRFTAAGNTTSSNVDPVSGQAGSLRALRDAEGVPSWYTVGGVTDHMDNLASG